jgi:predicted metal-dependent phosphoesterase TrpH
MNRQEKLGLKEEGRPLLKMDLHAHSAFSRDSVIPIRSIVRTWRRAGILSLVCDHDTLEGAHQTMRALRSLDPDLPEVLAEEITTDSGELIGLFLSEEIPAGLSAPETVDRIHDQGGLILVPHPFCQYRSRALRGDVREEVIGKIDLIEAFNARNVVDGDNDRAFAYAALHHKPSTVGSDAHTPMELGRVWQEIPWFEGPRDFLQVLPEGRIQFQRSPSAVHILTRVVKQVRTRNR